MAVHLDVALFPATLVRGEATEAVVTIDVAQPLSKASLTFQAPPGFAVEPRVVPLPIFSGRLVQHAVISPSSMMISDGVRPLLVRLSTAAEGDDALLASELVTFSYRGVLATSTYVVLGVL